MPTAHSCAAGFLGSTIEPASGASTPASEALHGSDCSHPRFGQAYSTLSSTDPVTAGRLPPP